MCSFSLSTKRGIVSVKGTSIQPNYSSQRRMLQGLKPVIKTWGEIGCRLKRRIKATWKGFKVTHITNLVVRLLGTGCDCIGFTQGRKWALPHFRQRWWLFVDRAVAVMTWVFQEQRGGWTRVWTVIFHQWFLRDAEKVHGEKNPPGQWREKIDNLVFWTQYDTKRRVTPVHGSNQVSTGST